MEQIRLDIIPKGLMPVCHSSQYDKGRVIRLNLVDGLQGYTLTDETVTLNVRKPDNNIVTAGVNVVSGASYVDIVTTDQMTACEGENLCEIVITKGDVKIASLNFKMKVEVDPLKDGIESETEIHNLETQIADINAEIVPALVADEVADQYDSSNVIFDDTPTEDHGIGYAVTSEGVKAYVDNKPNALVDLTDVDIDNPTSNQALVWNTTEEKWKNGEVSTVGSIDDLNDVDTTGKSTGDSLRYDGNEWIAKPTKIVMTQAEWNAIADKQAWRNAHKNTDLILSDAPNLNATAQDISYEGGADTVWDKVEAIGTELTAAWTASTTSAYGTNLTDSITVTKGTWVIAWGHPNQSGDIGCFISGIDTNSDISDQFITFDGGKELTKNTIIAKFTGNATLRVASGGSASVTFSNTTRGFLRAVKVSA